MNPLISILIPTRDRPELFSLCLESLADQEGDFEIIISDNFTTKSVKPIVDAYKGRGFVKYFHPPTDLEMPDNWEFAYRKSSGDLIVTLIDKVLLLPGALRKLIEISREHNSEIYSWSSEYYSLMDPSADVLTGYCSPQYIRLAPHEISTSESLQKRLEFGTSIGLEGLEYFRGKACFGAYRRSLTERLRERTGRVFHFFSPDFTTTVLALASTKKLIDFGHPLMLSILSPVSNGIRFAQDSSFAKKTVLWGGGRPFLNSPIKGLYASTHNLIAADYYHSLNLIGAPYKMSDDVRSRFVKIVAEDLDSTCWPAWIEQFDQWSRLKTFAGSRSKNLHELGDRPGYRFPTMWVLGLVCRMFRLLPFAKTVAKNDLVFEKREKSRAASKEIFESTYTCFSSPLDAAKMLSTHYGIV